MRLRIEGMDCAACAKALERSIAQLKGVEQARVHFSMAILEIHGDLETRTIAERVQAMGYRVTGDAKVTPGTVPEKATGNGEAGFIHYARKSRTMTTAFGAALLLLASLPLMFFTAPNWAQQVAKGLHVLAALLAGYSIALRGIRTFWYGRQITIDLLMSIAAAGALLIGETGEAATVILLFAVGESLEGYAAERARHSLRSLLALKPQKASVLRPCLDCPEHLGVGGYESGPCPICATHEVSLPVEQVQPGELVLVRPGDRIPVDGRVISGASAVNQSPVTGESMPVYKKPGEMVYAGTLNGESALEVEVTHRASDSTISQIVRLVEQAQTQRAPVERFIDRFAAWYTPAVVGLAILLASVPTLAFGAPFLDLPDGTRGWLYRALALLIVACPCALVISTPVTVVSALTGLARRGILVKGGAYLEALAKIRVFAFDKTGTLTRGQPTVVQVKTLECSPGETRCTTCDEMLALAAAVESRSEHPLAQAIVNESQIRGLSHAYPPAQEVQALAGRGVQGVVNGWRLTVSSHAHGHDNHEEHEALHHQIELAEADGHTVMVVSKDEKTLGFVAVSDLLRPTSQKALRDLKRIDPDFHTVVLTGDHPGVAQGIAAKIAELDEMRAGLMPADKVEIIRSLQKESGPVAMVGDGVNDAPALAAATVGIAMGGAGTAQAMETADIVLMQDDLVHLLDLVMTSRRTHRIIRYNIAFSLAAKAVFLLLVLLGWATLWMAVFADMGASLLVTFNGMRLLAANPRFRKPPS